MCVSWSALSTCLSDLKFVVHSCTYTPNTYMFVYRYRYMYAYIRMYYLSYYFWLSVCTAPPLPIPTTYCSLHFSANHADFVITPANNTGWLKSRRGWLLLSQATSCPLCSGWHCGPICHLFDMLQGKEMKRQRGMESEKKTPAEREADKDCIRLLNFGKVKCRRV